MKILLSIAWNEGPDKKEQRSIFDLPTKADISEDEKRQFGENPFCNNSQKKRESDTKSVLASESIPPNTDKFGKESCESAEGKKKAFRGLFHKDGSDGDREADKLEEIDSKSARKPWAFDGFKRWKKSNTDDETAPLRLGGRSSGEGACMESSQLVSSPIGKGPDTKHIKTKFLSDGSPSSGFFIDKVLGDKIKKELSRIQSELSSSNPNFHFSNDQMDAISTKLPVDKADLKQFFPKSWCERYGDVVLDVVKKEFKDHVGEMENTRNATLERRQNNSKRWTMFEDDENTHPNLFPAQSQSFFTSSNDEDFECGNGRSNTKCLNEKSAFSRAQNPFMNGSSC